MPEPIKEIKDFLEKIKEIKKNNYVECLFRGLSNSEWEIRSTASLRLEASHYTGSIIYSGMDFKEEAGYNETLITDYKHRLFKDYHGLTIAKADLAILAQLRHYGAATSLIDFTSDPLVALWFACNEESESDEPGVVYTLGIGYSEDFIHIYSDEQLESYTVKEIFNISNPVLPNTPRCFYWKPGVLNDRMPAQKSYFAIGDKNLQTEAKKNEVIIIDARAKVHILAELSEIHSINRLNLFPDISGFAEAHGKDVTVRKKEWQVPLIRFHTGRILENKSKIQTPSEKNLVERYHSGKSFLDRGQSKQELGDEEGFEKDQEEGRKLLNDVRDDLWKLLAGIVGKKFSYHEESEILKATVDFIRGSDDGKSKSIGLTSSLYFLRNIEHDLKRFKEANLIVDTTLEINPGDMQSFLMKLESYRGLIDNENDMEQKNSYIEEAIKYIDKEYDSCMKAIPILPPGTLKGMLYDSIPDNLKLPDKEFEDYLQNRISYCKQGVNEAPNNVRSLEKLGEYILDYLMKVDASGHNATDPMLIDLHKKAIDCFDKAIEIEPRALDFQSSRGTAIYKLAETRGVTLSEKQREKALKDLKAYEKQFTLYIRIPSKKEDLEKSENITKMLDYLEEAKVEQK